MSLVLFIGYRDSRVMHNELEGKKRLYTRGSAYLKTLLARERVFVGAQLSAVQNRGWCCCRVIRGAFMRYRGNGIAPLSVRGKDRGFEDYDY